MKKRSLQLGFVILLLSASCLAGEPLQISGRYPHLAVFNKGGECGIGAVVPWAERLWIITYSPHSPGGSDDKLYEIDQQLNKATRPESVGGTPANRMIHRESNQLSIGPYFIDAQRQVRVIPPSKMFGRLTATARHLSDPANKVYIYDMEGLLYEVDVHSLEPTLLFKRPVPGWHGKGGYSGQGRLVLPNNGESATGSVDRFKPFDYFLDPARTSPEDAGVLAEWDGREWRLIERRQFLDVTGPGGIYGPPSDDAPLWAIGWDRRSLLLKLCDDGQWSTFRLPVADYSYIATHGWHTEWPRIREVTGGKYLMNLHGGWFEMPGTFSKGRTGGLRAIADYLKITADFCGWGERIVFGCDDTALSGFNSARGGLEDTLNRLNGQSNSNLWFTTWEGLSQAGNPAGFGGPWVRDAVQANTPSDPYLLAGYAQRVLHLKHESAQPVTFALEIDADGSGAWQPYQKLAVPPKEYAYHVIPEGISGQWVRLTVDRDAAGVTAYFHYGPGGGATTDRELFAALADIDQAGPWTSAVVRSEGQDRITLGVLAQPVDAAGHPGAEVSYQVGPELQFQPTEPASASATFLRENAVVKNQILEIDEASVIVREGDLQCRLPKSHAGYDQPFATGWPRAVREVVTERSLLNAAGSFYLLPRRNSGGLRRIKPVCTHNKRISDFCSWRGLLVLAGCAASAKADGHYFPATDDGVGLWFGDIDDLWKLGKPVGRGGPWLETPVESGVASDPYLMAGYDQKTLELTHDAKGEVTIAIEVDVAGDGHWLPYAQLGVPAGESLTHEFPAGYGAHWVRFTADKSCRATARLTYR